MTKAPPFSPVEASRVLIRQALSAALATLDAANGAPFASLVAVATAADGSPLLLLSDLAAHTRNLKADARASLLFDETAGGGASAGDPLTGARVSLVGRITRIDAGPALAAARARFLARQPGAAVYADFRDFGFYGMTVDLAHLVAGFGRINDLSAAALLLDLTGADAIVAGEAEIVAHLNADHAATLALYATRLLGAPDGAWRAAGCDPGGLDLVLDRDSGWHCRRLTFHHIVRDAGALRAELKELAELARNRGVQSI